MLPASLQAVILILLVKLDLQIPALLLVLELLVVLDVRTALLVPLKSVRIFNHWDRIHSTALVLLPKSFSDTSDRSGLPAELETLESLGSLRLCGIAILGMFWSNRPNSDKPRNPAVLLSQILSKSQYFHRNPYRKLQVLHWTNSSILLFRFLYADFTHL